MKCPAYLCAESDICLLPKYHKLIAKIKKDETFEEKLERAYLNSKKKNE